MKTIYDECMATGGEPTKPTRKRSPKKNLEARVIRDCLTYLCRHPTVVYVERRNTGAVMFTDGSRVAFGATGAADIWCIARTHVHRANCRIDLTGKCCPEDWGPGCDDCPQLKHIEIECKRADGKGKQSQAQKDFQHFCNANGIPYLLVTSAEELTEKLRDILA